MHTFRYQLCDKALHIDYLRLRCGREAAFTDDIDRRDAIRAYISFSEWDVVMFIPSAELYPKTLIDIYSDSTLAGAIAGSAGFFNYLWDHRINENWEWRVRSRDKSISMLVSLRFTAAFRRQFGIGAELLFCSFLENALASEPPLHGVTAVVAHSVGWNDATILLDAPSGHERRLLAALTRIRYCTASDCVPGDTPKTYVIAATYSHVLGNLRAYTEHRLRFGDFTKDVKSARFLIRVNPDVELGLRDRLGTLLQPSTMAPADDNDTGRDSSTEGSAINHPRDEDNPVGSELGHYNFSADIVEAFAHDDAVSIIQGFREMVESFLTEEQHTDEASFPETTTEITFKEDLSQVREAAANVTPTATPTVTDKASEAIKTLSRQYKDRLEKFLTEEPAKLRKAHASMTAHRLAVLLGTIITYLDDPVRGSVVGHLCRFLDVTFEEVLGRSDRAGKEDLCHILEYALHQATDGLTQFQHDANSLGLNGRGGYNRLIQAVEEFVDNIIRPFHMRFVPLITFGLRPSNDGTTLKYWLDLPFSTAFVPERWYVAYDDAARMCWQHIFDWRLDSYRAWQVSQQVTPLKTYERENDRQEFVLARDVVDELFANFLLLNVVCGGDVHKLDRLLLSKAFLTQPRPAFIRMLTVRVVVDVLLTLHEKQQQRRDTALSESDIDAFSEADTPEPEPIRKLSVTAALRWWEDWSAIHERVEDEKEPKKQEARLEVAGLVEKAATSLRSAIERMKHGFSGTDAAQAFESTKNLISKPTFKSDATEIIYHVIGLLSARGRDYQARDKVSFEVFDPSAAEFGFVLGKIQVMRRTAQTASHETRRYRKAIEGGYVFAQGPAPPALAHMLTMSGESQFDDGTPAERNSHTASDSDGGRGETDVDERPARRHPSMLSSLSSILSLWHSAVTRAPGRDREYPTDLLATLQEFGVVSKEPF